MIDLGTLSGLHQHRNQPAASASIEADGTCCPSPNWW